jgi:hypothetical protein
MKREREAKKKLEEEHTPTPEEASIFAIAKQGMASNTGEVRKSINADSFSLSPNRAWRRIRER